MTPTTVRDRLRTRVLALAVFVPVVMACCGLVGLDVWRAWDARASAIAVDKAETASLARSLSQHAHDTVQAVDSAVLALREAAERQGLSEATAGRLGRLMRFQIQALPAIHGLLAFDAQGRYVVDSIAVPHAGLNSADRPYFQYHRDHPDRGVLVGGLVRAKVDGTWIVTVSRRLDTPQGDFAGVVVGTIAVDSLERFYGSIDVGEHGAIVLMASDGIVLALAPHDAATTGTSIAHGQFFARILPRSSFGSAEFVSAIDGATRIGSYERVEGFPLIVLVSHARRDVLAAWRTSTGIHLLASSAAAAMLLLLGGCLALQVRRRLAAEARLREQERHYRLLAENSTDLITRLGPDLRRTYVSPASRTLLGYEPEELLGRRPEETIVEEDLPAVSAAIAHLVAEGVGPPVSYRMRRADGTALWVEATGRRLEDGSGYLLAIRDISRRKAVEHDLHEANARLERLVMLDGLTGIDNRRSFDMALEREVRAAARSGLPLSLLMIDIDHFKRLNDSHGHSAGDECLRLIAATIGSLMKRPADHLARYGGEEFAVLLPQTESCGAALLAEWLCEAVRLLDLAHVIPGSAGGGISISIGVATLHPALDAASGRALVEAADKALYAAKQGGRDRAVVSDTMARGWSPRGRTAAVMLAG